MKHTSGAPADTRHSRQKLPGVSFHLNPSYDSRHTQTSPFYQPFLSSLPRFVALLHSPWRQGESFNLWSNPTLLHMVPPPPPSGTSATWGKLHIIFIQEHSIYANSGRFLSKKNSYISKLAVAYSPKYQRLCIENSGLGATVVATGVAGRWGAGRQTFVLRRQAPPAGPAHQTLPMSTVSLPSPTHYKLACRLDGQKSRWKILFMIHFLSFFYHIDTLWYL